jgi:hypothetical protein
MLLVYSALRTMADFPNIPLPARLQDSVRIYWLMSEWCNYSCDYCGVPVFFKRSPKRGRSNHAFDHYPVGEWLAAFRGFREKDIAMTITGGEPFLDRDNFPALLKGLLDDGRFSLRIFTNLSWDPAYYQGIDTSKIFLNTTLHPSQTTLADYRRRLHKVRDAGFSFSHVGVILAPENLDIAEEALTTFEAEGFPISAGTMQPAGKYLTRVERSPRERELITRYANPLSAYFTIVQPVTKGRACFHPAFSYKLFFDGSINVACVGARQNLFSDGIPEVTRHAMECPVQHCEGCTEMIRALVDLPQYGRPISALHPEELSKEIADLRAARNKGVLDPSDAAVLEEINLAFDAIPDEPPAAPFVPVESLTGPAGAPLGFIDKLNGSDVITGFGRDRMHLSGWAASARPGEPVREVNLFVAGKHVGSINSFYPRPEVVEHLNRPDALNTGWLGVIYLPLLERGEYPLVARVVTASGQTGELPAFTVRIID